MQLQHIESMKLPKRENMSVKLTRCFHPTSFLNHRRDGSGVSDLYVNSPCNFPLYLRTRSFTAGLQASAVCNKLANCMCCACCVEQRFAFALQKVGKGRLTLKKEQLSAIRSAYDQEDAFAWLLTGFGKSIEYKCLPFYSITS